MKTLFIDFFKFLCHPTCSKNQNLTPNYFFLILSAFLLSKLLVIPGIISLVILSIKYPHFNDLCGTLDYAYLSKFTRNQFLFQLILFGPIIEELSFRLFLVPRKYYFTVSVLVIYLTKLHLFRDGIQLFWIDFNLIKIILLIALCYFFETKTTIYKNLYSQYYPIFFYTMALLFGYLHVNNYTNLKHHLAFAPLFVLPQFANGLVLSYFRINKSFLLALILHSLFNLYPAIEMCMHFQHFK